MACRPLLVNASIYLGCSNIQWLTQEYRKIVQSIELPDRIGNDSGEGEGLTVESPTFQKELQKLIASIALEDDAQLEEINGEIDGGE